MGHLAAKDLYRQVGKKLDSLSTRAPWNATLRELLTRLFTEEEAALLVQLPARLTAFNELLQITGCEPAPLHRLLDQMAEKGLIVDLCLSDTFYYAPSPMMIGIFEFTMGREHSERTDRELAELFDSYLNKSFFRANRLDSGRMALLRALPHETAIPDDMTTEILDCERATQIVESATCCAVGICACRHEQEHLGRKACNDPLESCTSFGSAADYLVRHGIARPADKEEILDRIARSADCGRTMCADNVQRDVHFICHCCKCCCHALRAVRESGCRHAIVTSSWIAAIDLDKCVNCGRCEAACPVEAIHESKEKGTVVNQERCLGCGVCALSCPKGALKLVARPKRVIPPETILERILLEALERGTLAEQLFGEPMRVDMKLLKIMCSAFLRLPLVKQAMMSNILRSRFLNMVNVQLCRSGRSELADL